MCKSEGYIHINDVCLHDFRFNRLTKRDQTGGIILFFPTGNYCQPFILGIQNEEIIESSHFMGFNTNIYINEVFSRGQKIQNSFFKKGNNSVAIYAA